MVAKSTVADLSNWSPPQRIRRDAKGRAIVEKLSPLLSRKVVDLDGNVVQQPASNGIANRSPQDPYGQQTHHEKMVGRPRMIKGTPGGILPYSRCPQGINGVMPFLADYELDGRPICATAWNGKPISNEDPCACIKELIEKRQAKAHVAHLENEERVNKLAKLQERAAQQNLEAASGMAEATSTLAEVLKTLKGDGKGKRGDG